MSSEIIQDINIRVSLVIYFILSVGNTGITFHMAKADLTELPTTSGEYQIAVNTKYVKESVIDE